MQSPDRNGDVVDHAEAFAVAGECVVESAADVESETVLQGAARRENRSARREPEASHRSLGVRNFQSHALASAQRVVLEFVDPFASVHAQDVFIGGGFGSENVGGFRDALGQHEIANHSEFLRWKDVLAQTQIVTFVVDELERQHGPRRN